MSLQIEEPGRYYVEVTAYYPFGLDGVPEGVDYQLHASIEQHAKASFLFAPQPVTENEPGNNTDQPLDLGSDPGFNFFTFFDPNVGNVDASGNPLYGTNPIDFTTPYVRITGAGDFSYDIYSFEVAPAPQAVTPLGPVQPVASIGAATGTGTTYQDSNPYYTS